MNTSELIKQSYLSEDSTRQFKVDVRNAESLASEMAAFANSAGGTIYLGVADDGSIGSVIKRALTDWPDIDFKDDHDGSLYAATVRRKAIDELNIVTPASGISRRFNTTPKKHRNKVSSALSKSLEKGSEKILSIILKEPTSSAAEIGRRLDLTSRAVEKQIASLKASGAITRIGPAKGGHWEVLK